MPTAPAKDPLQAHPSYYYALLDTHATAEFAVAVPIMEFMRNEGSEVFTNMHMNWDGIEGIDFFEYEDTPPVLKPTCRPIIKNIYEIAEKEFNRLRGYLLFPSDSPVCSSIGSPRPLYSE